MKQTHGPTLRTAALVMFSTALTMLLFDPPSLERVTDWLALLMGGIAIVLIAAWAMVMLIGDEAPEREFRRIVDRSEELANLPPVGQPLNEFDELVVAAIDDLPDEFRKVVDEVPILVSHRGHEHHAYGHYIGNTIVHDNHRDHIIVYQDTLERDFGHDPELLRAQVQRTVRHEIAHHLGWGEHGVRNLGL
jgi:predicted Zn-dependent protease with MMP-like domain